MSNTNNTNNINDTYKVYTFGYSGSAHEDLQAFMVATGAMLVDIRYSPRSRHPDWDGEALRFFVGQENYMHIQALGNRNYNNGGPVALENVRARVEALRPILERRSVILLCACNRLRLCHRWNAAIHVGSVLDAEIEHLPSRFGEWQRAAV
jgi:hypothetical protein